MVEIEVYFTTGSMLRSTITMWVRKVPIPVGTAAAVDRDDGVGDVILALTYEVNRTNAESRLSLVTHYVESFISRKKKHEATTNTMPNESHP